MRDIDHRFAEQTEQYRDCGRSMVLIDIEGTVFSGLCWEVITFLRGNYLEHGLPGKARAIAMVFDSHFNHEGGS